MLKVIERGYLDNILNRFDEAGLRNSDISRALQIIANQIKKNTGKNCYVIDTGIDIINSDGEFTSFSLIVGNKSIVRLNMKKGNKSSSSFESIEFFFTNYNKPDITFTINMGYNILQVLKVIIDTINSPKEVIASMRECYMKAGKVMEKAISKEQDFKDWVASNNYSDTYITETKKITLFNDYSMWGKREDKTVVSLPTFNLVMKDYLKSKGLTHTYDRVRTAKNKTFEFISSKEDKELINYIKKNESLDDLEDSLQELKLDMSILKSRLGKDGKNLLICYGRAGVSKSTTIKKALIDNNMDVAYIRINDIKNTGDFYKILYVNNGRTLLFDDSDIIIKKSSPISAMLLSATDDSVKNRRLTYFNTSDSSIIKSAEKELDKKGNLIIPKGKYPQQFNFTGSVIAISNLTPPKMNSALVSRAIITELSASDSSLITEIMKGIDEYFPDYSKTVKQLSVDFIIALRGENVIKALDFRHYSMILGYFNSDTPIDIIKPILIKKLMKMR